MRATKLGLEHWSFASYNSSSMPVCQLLCSFQCALCCLSIKLASLFLGVCLRHPLRKKLWRQIRKGQSSVSSNVGTVLENPVSTLPLWRWFSLEGPKYDGTFSWLISPPIIFVYSTCRESWRLTDSSSVWMFCYSAVQHYRSGAVEWKVTLWWPDLILGKGAST